MHVHFFSKHTQISISTHIFDDGNYLVFIPFFFLLFLLFRKMKYKNMPASCFLRLDYFAYLIQTFNFTQAKFEELWRNFSTYNSGEQLLGLPVTDYDCLQKKKCVTTLQKSTLHYQNNTFFFYQYLQFMLYNTIVMVFIFMVFYNVFRLINL